jgi:hypothetical protein
MQNVRIIWYSAYIFIKLDLWLDQLLFDQCRSCKINRKNQIMWTCINLVNIAWLSGAPEAMWSGGGSISKGHLLLSHNFSVRQYLLKLYCMDTRLLVAIVGRQTSTLILNNFICCTMLRAQNKISKRTYIIWFSINQGPWNRGAMGACASPLF